MTETDGENRDIALVKLPYLVDNGSAVLGVSGAVGEHDAVRIGGDDFLGLGACRVNGDLTAPLMEGTGDITLCAQVKKRYPVAVIFHHRLFTAGNFFYDLTGTICF